MKLRGFEFISTEQARKDFGKDLSIAEIALLTGIPNNPTIYDPITKFKNANNRKDSILNKMYQLNMISKKQLDEEKNREIVLNIKKSGLKTYMQPGEVLMAFPRSGLGFKYYCRLANTVGVIDGDYYNNSNNEGHMFVKLRNEGTKEMVIKQGDGMCQMIFMPFLLVDGDSFDNGEERKGGFGSTTGVK